MNNTKKLHLILAHKNKTKQKIYRIPTLNSNCNYLRIYYNALELEQSQIHSNLFVRAVFCLFVGWLIETCMNIICLDY